jgi:endonuclease VIII
MPEGDTVWRTARNLAGVLEGRTLTRCDVRVPAFATFDATGDRVDEVLARGKHLLIRVGEHTVHSHLAMEGSWHIHPLPAPRWRRPSHTARIVLRTEAQEAVGFDLGLLEVVARRTDEELLSYLGPDLLGPGWDPDEALRRLVADPARPIGLALLDQRVLAGLGNVYRNELCFLRGVLPTRPAGAVRDPARLIALAHRTIAANRDRTERTTTGDLRRGRRTWVYGRGDEPCRRCGTPIARGELGDDDLRLRVTYWCPRCQS